MTHRILVTFFISLLFCSLGSAEEISEFKLKIKDHKFEPAELIIPRDKKVKLIVKNEDSTVEEFESFDLKREKIVPAGKEIKISIGPLKPGTYKFFGEFHEKTAQGIINVK